MVTLANDAMAPWLRAMARSLRRFSPEIPVQVVPFDDRLSRTARICREFRFDLIAPQGLDRFDRLGGEFLGESNPMRRTFRKLAAFELGPSVFLFLDADIVVLDRLEKLLEAFAGRTEPLGYFDTDLEKVYRNGPFRDRMLGSGRSVGFITGSFLSRAGAVPFSEAAAAAREVAAVRSELSGPLEQPFLNYCFDRLGCEKVAMSRLVAGLGGNWAGDPELRRRVENASWRALLLEPRPPFVHWAGFDLKYKMPCAEVFFAFSDRKTKFVAMRRWLAGAVERRIADLRRRSHV